MQMSPFPVENAGVTGPTEQFQCLMPRVDQKSSLEEVMGIVQDVPGGPALLVAATNQPYHFS
jgi:hypothetical protein